MKKGQNNLKKKKKQRQSICITNWGISVISKGEIKPLFRKKASEHIHGYESQ